MRKLKDGSPKKRSESSALEDKNFLKKELNESVTSLKHLHQRSETLDDIYKPTKMNKQKKPFKLIPLHKARNIEKTMRGKFVNNFSSNLHSKVVPKQQKTQQKVPIEKKNYTNLLNPLKDFIDDLAFDLGGKNDNDAKKQEDKSVDIENNTINKVGISNNDEISKKDGVFLTKQEFNKEGLLINKNNLSVGFNLPRIIPNKMSRFIGREEINDANSNKFRYNMDEYGNNTCANSNVMRIEKFPEERKKNPYQKNKKSPSSVALNPFTYNFNKELGRVSNNFGKNSSMKYFANNPKTEYYFERSPSYKIYKNFKVLADKDMIKPRLLPLKVYRETSYEKLSGSFFDLHKSKHNQLKMY